MQVRYKGDVANVLSIAYATNQRRANYGPGQMDVISGFRLLLDRGYVPGESIVEVWANEVTSVNAS